MDAELLTQSKMVKRLLKNAATPRECFQILESAGFVRIGAGAYKTAFAMGKLVVKIFKDEYAECDEFTDIDDPDDGVFAWKERVEDAQLKGMGHFIKPFIAHSVNPPVAFQELAENVRFCNDQLCEQVAVHLNIGDWRLNHGHEHGSPIYFDGQQD